MTVQRTTMLRIPSNRTLNSLPIRLNPLLAPSLYTQRNSSLTRCHGSHRLSIAVVESITTTRPSA